MAEIEEALHKLHAREKAKREQDASEAQEEAMEQQLTLPSPFARVDAVTEGSPASGAVSHNSRASVFSPFSDKSSQLCKFSQNTFLFHLIFVCFFLFKGSESGR